jgi:glycosyltransferase involved in cell wall biosynthesis
MRGQLTADGFPADMISVVRSPFEDLAEAQQEWVTPDQPPAILFVGRLVDIKAPDHLLEASAKIKIAHQVWVVGDGPLLARLQTQARELGISDRVKFFGTQTPDEIAVLRRRCTLAVVPSVCPEVFGRVGPESLLARRPVVAYRVGGIPEWLTDQVTGRLIPVGDVTALAKATEEIVSNPDLARQMGSAGAADAVKWLAADHGVQLRGVYQDALRRWRSASPSTARCDSNGELASVGRPQK